MSNYAFPESYIALGTGSSGSAVAIEGVEEKLKSARRSLAG